MYFLECLLILFWMGIVPVLIGMLVINQLFKEEKMDFLLAWVCGSIGMLAIFYIFVMPMLYLKLPLHILVLCWSFFVLFFCILSLIFNRRRYKDILRYNFRQFKSLPWFVIIVSLLILTQVIILVFFQHEDADDAFYVANATTALATDSIFQFDPYTGLPFITYPLRYVMSPFPIFYALLSKLLLIHPTIIAHTVWPVFAIPLSYAILTVLGKKIFPDQQSSVVIFLLFLCVLNIFGYVSIYTNSTFLLFRIWQGKAVLANIVLPAILYFSLRAMPGEKNFGEWVMLFVCALVACLVSSFGIVLAPIMIACLGLAAAASNRRICTFIYSIICCVPCIACGIFSMIIY